MIKKFNTYREQSKLCNESLKDKIVGKSDEELKQSLLKLHTLNRIRKIKSLKLDDSFLPSDEEIKESLEKMNTIQRIITMKSIGISDKFLPSDEKVIKEIKKSSDPPGLIVNLIKLGYSRYVKFLVDIQFLTIEDEKLKQDWLNYGLKHSFKNAKIKIFKYFLKLGADIESLPDSKIDVWISPAKKKRLKKVYDEYKNINESLKDNRVKSSFKIHYLCKLAEYHDHHDIVKVLKDSRKKDVKNIRIKNENIRKVELNELNEEKNENVCVCVARYVSFNSYNESLRDKLKGKTDEEILKIIENLTPQEQFLKACEFSILSLVKKLINDGVNPTIQNNYGIRYASENGHTEIVKELLKDNRVDPSANNNYCIRRASENGYIETVKELLKDNRVDPSVDDNYAIQVAEEGNHTEIVKLLKQHLGLNESLRDKLKGKTDEEIENVVKGLDTLTKIWYVQRGKIPKKYMPSDEEINIELKKINKWDTRLLLDMYQKIKWIDNRELLHFLSDHDAFTVTWYTIENVLDEELGENGYDELYDMTIDDQIDFIESNTYFDTESLKDISIDQIERNDEKFKNIKKIILKEIS